MDAPSARGFDITWASPPRAPHQEACPGSRLEEGVGQAWECAQAGVPRPQVQLVPNTLPVTAPQPGGSARGLQGLSWAHPCLPWKGPQSPWVVRVQAGQAPDPGNISDRPHLHAVPLQAFCTVGSPSVRLIRGWFASIFLPSSSHRCSQRGSRACPSETGSGGSALGGAWDQTPPPPPD